MKKNRRFLSILVILSLLGAMGLAACGQKSGTVVYGKVTVVNNDTITIAVGTLNQQTGSIMDIPSGAGSGRQRTTSGETPGGRYPGNGSGMPSDGGFSRPDTLSGFDPAAGNPGGRPNNGSGTTSGFNGGNNNDFSQRNAIDLSTLLTLTGSTKFVTISDPQTITKVGVQAVMGSGAAASQAGTPGTLTDITVGSILRITYQNGSDKILSVEIIESLQPGAARPGGTQSGTASSVAGSSSN